MAKFGALYNCYTIKTGKIAPEGWHISDNDHWDKIDKAVATKTDWKYCADIGMVGNDPATNNSSGFSALPGGACGKGPGWDSALTKVGEAGAWWSVTERDGEDAYSPKLGYISDRFV